MKDANIMDKTAFIKEYSQIASDFRLVQNPESIVVVASEHKTHLDLVPTTLYKYRPINDYTLDSIANNYLYLAPLNKMDDPFEGAVKHMNLSELELRQRFQSDDTFKYFITKLFEFYHIYTDAALTIFTKQAFSENQGKYDFYYATKYLIEDSKLSFDLTTKILSIIEAFIRNNSMQDAIIKGISSFCHLRETTGVCSLTTNCSNQQMWATYGDEYKGCCIAYSIENDDYSMLIDLVPIHYDNTRNFDPVLMMVESFAEGGFDNLETLFANFTNKLFLVSTRKGKEWENQDEWRIIGEATKQKTRAPAISSIIIGNQCSNENKKRVEAICANKHIPLKRQVINYETGKIEFEDYE